MWKTSTEAQASLPTPAASRPSVTEQQECFVSARILFKILFINFLAVPHSKQNLNSPTKDWTHAPCSGVLTTGLPGKPQYQDFS